MRTTAWLFATALLMLPASALGNPISVDAFRVRQMPDSTSVQITYGIDSSGTSTTPTIVSLKRDGTLITGTWTGNAFTANTGSGLKSLSAKQLCDCAMTPGTYKYELTVKTSASGGTNYTHTATVTVTKNPPMAKDAGSAKGDLAPWDIPEPTAVQGLDCTKTCAAGGDKTQPDGGSVKLDKGSSTDACTVNCGGEKKDDGGCAVASSSSPASGLLLLALLGLALLRRRTA